MRAHPVKCLIVYICTAVLLGCPAVDPATADEAGPHERGDHDVARDALERGDILSLEAVLAAVRKAIPGEVVGIEIEHTKDGWMYEVKVIAPNGAILKIEVDAKTGQFWQKRKH